MSKNDNQYSFKTRVKNIIKCVIRDMSDPFYINVAPSLAYYFIVSIAPIIIAVTYFANFFLVGKSYLTRAINNYLPEDVAAVLVPLFGNTPTTASLVVTVIFFVFTLFLASRGLYGMIKVADYAADNLSADTFADVPKNYVKRRIKALIMTLLFLLLIMITLVLTVFGRTVVKLLENKVDLGKMSGIIDTIYTVFSIPVSFVAIIFILMLVYAWMPSKRERFIDVLPGVLVTAVGVMLASIFFIIYIKFFFIRDLIYGALSSIIIIVLWFFLFSNVVVIGMVVNRAWKETKPDIFHDFDIMPLKKTEDAGKDEQTGADADDSSKPEDSSHEVQDEAGSADTEKAQEKSEAE